MKYGVGEQEVGANVAAKYKSILENSSIQYVVIGGNADDAAKTAMAKSYGDLKNLIESGGQFSSKNPGVPIVYTVKFLKDNQLAKMGYATDFVKVECEEKEEMFIKLYHAGGYVAKFKISWVEDGKDKSWDSGDKTAGYSETVNLPYNAQDIRIAAWAYTGLVWDSLGEIIKELVTESLKQLNKCYRVYGTTLDRRWDSNCP